MKQPEVVVIDYGVGNLLSVQRGLECSGAKVILSADREQILNATHVVLPGVGAFGKAMQALQQLELIATIRNVAENKVPLLGICLGMQLLLDVSEEFGLTNGLGLIPGKVVAVPCVSAADGARHKIPHIGWNELRPVDSVGSWKQTILQDTKKGDAVYFVHSFMAEPSDPAHRLSDCLYGQQKIAAVIRRDNIYGCQFHPEKSGAVGLRMLHQFIQL